MRMVTEKEREKIGEEKGKKKGQRKVEDVISHKHKKQKEALSITTLPTVLTTLGVLRQDHDSNTHGVAQSLVRDVLDLDPNQNTNEGTHGRKKLRPSVMQREMKFHTVHGNRTWPMRELISEIEGNITLGGLMMVHERDEEMICGKIMPQGGLQVNEHCIFPISLTEVSTDIERTSTLSSDTRGEILTLLKETYC